MVQRNEKYVPTRSLLLIAASATAIITSASLVASFQPRGAISSNTIGGNAIDETTPSVFGGRRKRKCPSACRLPPTADNSRICLEAKGAAATAVEYGVDVPYKEANYDPHAADEFFKDRKLKSFFRLVDLVSRSSGFVAGTILDSKVLDREAAMVDKRSAELLELVTDLGPTFIKVGQALSTRTDLLPAEYAKGLVGLQDAVPPFDAAVGRAVIERELGIRIDDVFSSLSPEPVASASIGQVYRGTLRKTGEDVAVKVQRPAVLADVSLDLYMMRRLAPLWKKSQDINTDLVGLVDAWGEGFVAELDYRAEARATTEFSRAMKARGLSAVFAPEVVEELSSTHVLTTKWVDGVRLADSDADDVPRLCGVALNAYLTMLLDTGTLHCDPHPGNLLRTSDGRLCILDFGMVLNVPDDLQLSLLEFIADLNAENYEDVPDDLVNLGFVPKDKIDELRTSGLTVAIANMLQLAAEGGGPKGAMKRMVAQNKEKYAEALKDFDDLDSKEATDVRQRLFREDWERQMAEDALSREGGGGKAGAPPTSATADVTSKIEQMQQENADVFAIPDYFVYMSRAFSVLEGIGLSSDENYSILQECYPYLAKRLLSDDSPRARGALRTLLYGNKSGGDGKGNELNLSKVRELTSGFESYTSSTTSVESGRGRSDEGRDAALAQLADVVLAEGGNYVQELLIREAAVALDATARDALLRAASSSPLTPVVKTLLPPPTASLPGVLRPLAFPLDLIGASLELQSVDNSRDERRLENVRILTDLIARGEERGETTSMRSSNVRNPLVRFAGGAGEGEESLRTASKIIEEASKRRSALGRMGLRFGKALVSVQAERLRNRPSEAAKRGKGATNQHRVSELADRLAESGANGLEGIADVIGSLDGDLERRR